MVFNKSHFLVLLQGSGVGGEASPSLFLGDLIVVLAKTCVHLCSRFVGEERGVHTQVEHNLISRPSLLSFPSLCSADRKLGGNLATRLISNIQMC